MKILTYSDLHFEFGHHWLPPKDMDGDLMILAGDIISFKDHRLLSRLLTDWNKPVIYVAGNHEYYTQRPMNEENETFKTWLAKHHPNVFLLLDEAITINGINFFGGTMWTDFNDADPNAMKTAQSQMNDFRLIRHSAGKILQPMDTVTMHHQFVTKLLAWFQLELKGPRVVVSHHAPVINPNTKYPNSPLMPAFNSLDMIDIIEHYQPSLWVYGHTHECDDQMIGQTRIISNQLGYPKKPDGFECANFKTEGFPIMLTV